MKSLGPRVTVENNRVPGAWDHPDVSTAEATRVVTVALPVLQCPVCKLKFYPIGEDAEAVVERYESHTCWELDLPARPAGETDMAAKGKPVADGGEDDD